jgi:hypothetical protein
MRHITNPSFLIFDALSLSGYDLQTAICDIIDNSNEKRVDATNIYVVVDYKTDNPNIIIGKKTRGRPLSTVDSISRVMIIDNGCGMDDKDICKFFTLAHIDNNKGFNDFGVYGMGAKTSGYSIGNKITVLTKTKISSLIKKAWQSREDMQKYSDLSYNEVNISEKETILFNQYTNGIQGTIVIIDDIKTNMVNHKNLIDKLTLSLRKTFTEFLKTKTIYLNGLPIKTISLVHGKNIRAKELSDLEHIVRENCHISSQAFYLDGENKDYDLPVNQDNSGAYIRRNGRLVGAGLKFGNIFGNIGDGHTSKLRFIIDVDGHADKLFGSTYNKMITEKDKNSMPHEFIELLNDIARGPKNKFNVIESERIRKTQKVKDIENGIIDTKRTKDSIKKSGIRLDSGIGVNDKMFIPKINTLKNRGEKLDPIKERNKLRTTTGNNRCFLHEVVYIDNGNSGNVYDSWEINGKYTLAMNTGHEFYKKLYVTLDAEQQNMCRLYFISGIHGFNKAHSCKYNEIKDEILKGIIDYETNRSEVLSAFLKTFD